MNTKRDEWLAHEAAEWVDRLERADARQEKTFFEYLRESPRNVQEVLIAQAWEDELGSLLDTERRIDVDELVLKAGNVVPVTLAPGRTRQPSSSEHAHPHKSPIEKTQGRRWLWTAMAASIAGLFLAALFSSTWLRERLRPTEFVTSVGEQRSLELADGSVIVLNARSAARVDFSDTSREVYLSKGQALFAVAKDMARPFRVHAAGAIVQAIGTKFDVRREADRVEVAVIEGSVAVTGQTRDAMREPFPNPTKLAAGEAIRILRDGKVSAPALVNTAEISAWQQRRLVFRGHTLAEIADEFSRYNQAPQIIVEGEALRARRIPVAVFDADDPESLVAFLADDQTLAFERKGSDLVISVNTVTSKESNTSKASYK